MRRKPRPLPRGEIWAVAGVGVAFAALGVPLVLGMIAPAAIHRVGLTLGLLFCGVATALLAYAWINCFREREAARAYRRRKGAALETVRYFLLEIDKLQGSPVFADGDYSSAAISVTSAPAASRYADVEDLAEEDPEKIREQFRDILHRNFCVYPFNKSALAELLAQNPGELRLGHVQDVLLRRQADIDPWIIPD